jgi:GntR family transcriptional regulator, transcriptional repressor for pyruvate dehydrogenase complex
MQLAEQTNLGPLRATQLYERIADRIAGEIRIGLLKPGERLPSERDLAQRLEVGRSSVREAIAAL